MERHFNNEDFERFLKNSADQYRMYPAEKVWKNIYRSIHTRRRWFGLGALLFLSAGIASFLFFGSPFNNNTSASSGQTPAKTPGNEQGLSPAIDPSATTLDPVTANSVYLKTDPASKVQQPSDKLETIARTVQQEALVRALPLSQDLAPVVVADNRSMADNERSPESVFPPSDAADQDSYINGFPAGRQVESRTLASLIPEQPEGPAVFPWTIESVINTYASIGRKRNPWSMQWYFTPTVSYRKLSDNKSYLRTAQFSGAYNYLTLNNINEAVTHKPDLGIEVGFASRYAVNDKMRIRAGLQFNVSRYGIKAFNNPYEIATIALNNGRGVDSLSTITKYRNYSGTRSSWLENLYFQVSAPVGIEMTLGETKNVKYGVAGTIQPTYVLGERAYLLTSDYKNYAKVPWLIRRWNANTSFEAFVGYSTGRLNWQVGPQVRYQLLSSFVEKYPVRENLFDFGLKVGVTVNK